MELRRITVHWSGLVGLPGTTTMHFQNTALDLGDLVDGLDEFWAGVADMGDASTGGLSNSVHLTLDPEVQVIDDSDGHLVEVQTIDGTHTWTGSGTGEPLPPANQMLIEWITATVAGSRILRGRTFIGGLTEQHATNGVPDPEARAKLQALAQTLCLESMMIYSPTYHLSGGVPTASVWTKMAVLRSRRD